MMEPLIWISKKIGMLNEIGGLVTRIVETEADIGQDPEDHSYMDVFLYGSDREIYRWITQNPNLSPGDNIKILYKPASCSPVNHHSYLINFTMDLDEEPIIKIVPPPI